MTGPNHYRRFAQAVTTAEVLSPAEKQRLLKRGPVWNRRKARVLLEADWAAVEITARAEASAVIDQYDGCVASIEEALGRLAQLNRPRLAGRVGDDLALLSQVRGLVGQSRAAVDAGDFGAAGRFLEEAERHLFGLGGELMVALNQELGRAAYPRERREELQRLLDARRQSQDALAEARDRSAKEALQAAARLYELVGQSLASVAAILAGQPARKTKSIEPRRQDGAAVVQPEDLETLVDVGGLDKVKARLQRSVAMITERPAAEGAARHNGVLLYGPPGTGKTLLARAIAGEYGMRFVRFSPATVGSAYAHEPARRLRELFALAAESAPCVLFLDEIELIAGRRDSATTAEGREMLTQLLNSLDEYRDAPGLLIMGATNAVDELDPALREGRFDVRLAVPMPDAAARERVFEVHLRRAGEGSLPKAALARLAERSSGLSGASVAAMVVDAAERAAMRGAKITEADLQAALGERGGRDRARILESPVTWGDVVLPPATERQLREILTIFEQPELGRSLGVSTPAGILLYGPPGTGKTTIAKALATEVESSFYEQSAADLLSKFVGESEDRVMRLFQRARDNRPAIIFIDEIDSLLRRRARDSVAPWEERLVSQFLRELDGLPGMTGVLLVGATNRPDIIDEAVRERRLVEIEVPMPDRDGRARLLELLSRNVSMAPDVDFATLANQTDGYSGADLKAMCNAAGVKALMRSAGMKDKTGAAVNMNDFVQSIGERRDGSVSAAGSRRRRVSEK